MMTTKTPVALLLAKRLESRYDLHYTERARIALELRRLVAENRRLSEVVDKLTTPVEN